VAQATTKTDTDAIGILIAFLVLLIGFGSVVAGLLPLFTAIAGVALTNLALLALTARISESSTTPVLATMIGLAVGIDYSLFVMNRHRQQVADGMELHESVGRAVATSGSAVCFAGLTVLIALAALSVVNIPFLTVMGLSAGPARLRRSPAHLLPLGPPPDRQGGRPRLRAPVLALRGHPQEGTDRGRAGRDRPLVVRGHSVLPHEAGPARRRLAADQPDHAARL
jgi:hypothetical protein